MRAQRRLPVRFVVVAMLAMCTLSPAALAEPALAAPASDTPWDEIDRVLKETPDSGDDQIAPPAASTERGSGEALNGADPGSDRLAPENAKSAAAVTAIPAQTSAAAQTPRPLSEAGRAKIAAAKQADTTQFEDPGDGDGADSEPAETPPTVVAPPPTGAAVAAPTIFDPAKFHLPLKRYFETKSAVTLATYDQADREALTAFYDQRFGEPLWVSKTGFNDAAQSLIAELQRANDYGLQASAYKAPVLNGSGELNEDDLSDAEIKLSLVAMMYARHARGDRIPDPTTQLSSYIDRKPNLIERRSFLNALAAAEVKGDYLRAVHPKHPQFEKLRQKLLELRAGGAEPALEKIPSGSTIRPGKSHPHVAILRKRLQVALPGMKPDGTAADASYFDDTLARAVTRYREQNDLSPKPVLDKELRNALNKPNDVTESLLLTNMEQWRWMPDDLGSTYIAVNIPEFTVRVMKDGAVLHTERVVTGQISTQTPIFSDHMSKVVFQPSWNVPNSIKVNELLPRLRAGGNPISGRGLEIKRNGRQIDPWDIDWSSRDIRNYDIYQPPGGGNVLGVVKFMFPNKHSVYLHDTPSKSLFNASSRTFSHGCVRVRNPVRLAEVLMAEDKGWDKSQVKDVIENGPGDNDVLLDHKIPIHITYFTAWVDDSGDVHRFADVYGHEERIKLGMAGRFDEISKNRDHLLPSVPPPAVARRRDNYYYDDYGMVVRQPRRQGYSYYEYGTPQKYKKKQGSLGKFLKQVFGDND